MVALGTIHDWRPKPGTVISWSASPRAREVAAQAPASAVPPSYQQAQHVRSYRDLARQDREMARLGIGSWDVPGVCDVDAMTAAINAHLRRHDTYHSWFEFDPADNIVRHVIDDPETIDFVPQDHGLQGPDEIRAHLLRTSGTPLSWDCFTFGVIQRADHFTVYISVDHLHTDGMSTGILYVEIQLMYASLVHGSALQLPPPAGYLDFSARELAHNQAMTLDSFEVQTWARYARDNGGTLPDFALPLGDRSALNVGAMLAIPLLDADETVAFEKACEQAGVRFSGGVFACTALIDRELTGADTFYGITPYDTRSSAEEQMSVGWYASFIPFVVDLADGSFAAVARSAQKSFDECQPLAKVPFERVLELAGPDSGLTAPEYVVPMVSFLDARKIPVSAEWDRINGGIYGDSRSSDQVCMWVNRFENETNLTISFPDNAVARESVSRYFEVARVVYQRVAQSQFVS
ncbi:condensation domain-containing protein [Mycobacteroides franklinii]|uniref:condensation domain-containing protein n=1 Tax=Mycobacteroides franklinii TaxID=948102 RepID=UPI0013E8AAFB|nr:acyltransferase [Mycobacteroides franklinii]